MNALSFQSSDLLMVLPPESEFTAVVPIEKPTRINYMNLRKAYNMLLFLKRPHTMKLLSYITDQYQTCTELYIRARMDQSETSQILMQLKSFDLVKSRRIGKYIFYKVNSIMLEKVVNTASELSDMFRSEPITDINLYPR